MVSSLKSTEAKFIPVLSVSPIACLVTGMGSAAAQPSPSNSWASGRESPGGEGGQGGEKESSHGPEIGGEIKLFSGQTSDQ